MLLANSSPCYPRASRATCTLINSNPKRMYIYYHVFFSPFASALSSRPWILDPGSCDDLRRVELTHGDRRSERERERERDISQEPAQKEEPAVPSLSRLRPFSPRALFPYSLSLALPPLLLSPTPTPLGLCHGATFPSHSPAELYPLFINTDSHYSLARGPSSAGSRSYRLAGRQDAPYSLKSELCAWKVALYSCATCSLLVLPDVFEAREISVTPTDVCTAAVSAL